MSFFEIIRTTEDIAAVVNNRFETVIEGDIFIIPNSVVRPEDPNYRHAFGSMMVAFGNVGLDATGRFAKEPLVEVWTRSELADNMGCHRFDMPGTGPKVILFPSRLPLSALRDLREGEHILLPTASGTAFLLKANQKEFRYRGFGRFEEVLSKLLKN